MQNNLIIPPIITQATAKALATYHPDMGINVVPVSSIQIVGDTIWLIDYFMEKTSKNIQICPDVSLVCRKDMFGYQIKAHAEYIQSGELYDKAYARVHPLFPERTVNGLIILHPTHIYDIAPTKDTDNVWQE